MRHHGKMRKSTRQYLCQLRELTAFPGILRVLLTQEQGYRARSVRLGVFEPGPSPRRLPGTRETEPLVMLVCSFCARPRTFSGQAGRCYTSETPQTMP